MTSFFAQHGLPLGIAVVVAVVVALAGGLATDIGPWYATLKKPGWKPPDWAFGPVWTTIFALCVAAAVIVWSKAESDADRILIIVLFAANIVLNIAWSILFFTLKRPDWAFYEVIGLWFSILALIIGFWRFSPTASLLILPYILWVSLAAVLNWRIVALNGPFASAG